MTTYAKMNKYRFGVLLALAATGAVVSCNNINLGAVATTTRAHANLVNTTGQNIGIATLTENQPGTVSMVVSVTGLPAGQHGIHFHMVGKAEPPTSFTSAGEHFNPDMKQHGMQNPSGYHNGDLPNLVVDAQGVGRLETSTTRITLGSGATSVFDADGTALVIHANADDMKTDPSGNSGGRIAAGVLTRN